MIQVKSVKDKQKLLKNFTPFEQLMGWNKQAVVQARMIGTGPYVYCQ